MALIGSIAATVCEDDDVGVRSGHRPAKKGKEQLFNTCTKDTRCAKILTISYIVLAKERYTISKNIFLENGLVEREHGNTKNRPHNALTFARITNMLKFIENYAEKHAILLPSRIPGFKRDDVSVLPTSDSKQVISL